MSYGQTLNFAATAVQLPGLVALKLPLDSLIAGPLVRSLAVSNQAINIFDRTDPKTVLFIPGWLGPRPIGFYLPSQPEPPS